VSDESADGGVVSGATSTGGPAAARVETAVLERSATFTASHHYRHPAWSDDQNWAVFGKLSEPHEHEYRATVWIRGEMAPVTGFITDLPALDQVLEELFGPLNGGDINAFVPEFATGEQLPSCENLARWAFRELGDRLSGVQLLRVRIAESPDLAAEYPGGKIGGAGG
jgi:6-pyruvoyltetrahydropterin/6-carboxytetrahydropterin synthase